MSRPRHLGRYLVLLLLLALLGIGYDFFHSLKLLEVRIILNLEPFCVTNPAQCPGLLR